jgi:hypothetical protein
MTWQPGQSILSASDYTEWQTWCKVRKLEAQRQRRRQYPRIDYCPSKEALAVIQARTHGFIGGDYSSVIDALVLESALTARR